MFTAVYFRVIINSVLSIAVPSDDAGSISTAVMIRIFS